MKPGPGMTAFIRAFWSRKLVSCPRNSARKSVYESAVYKIVIPTGAKRSGGTLCSQCHSRLPKLFQYAAYFRATLVLVLCLGFGHRGWGQDISPERAFPQSRISVEHALNQLHAYAAGPLPTLEGFASTGNRPLDRFQRGYYQCNVQIKPDSSGGSLVRVSAKITAWYAAADAARSGYQVLPSNGRLEADLLDRLQEALGEKAPVPPAQKPAWQAKPGNPSDSAAPTISAPMPRIPASALHAGLLPPPPAAEQNGSLKLQTDAAEKRERDLAGEAKGLEEILRNQAHPTNLVAVKRDGTPVLQSARLDAASLFAASAGDEFEILDVTAEWIHVRISGLSRGWIRRSSLEMPAADSESTQTANESHSPDSSVPFRVTGRQFAPFPGDWASLRGRTVEIFSIQKTGEKVKGAGPQDKLEFAKALFDKEYAAASSDSAGIVLIFDSDDGGMVAATVQSLQQWKTGKLSDQAFWRQCFFDPPEILGAFSN